MQTAPANDNRLSCEVEMLRDAIEALEDNADSMGPEDFTEVERLYNKLKEMVES